HKRRPFQGFVSADICRKKRYGRIGQKSETRIGRGASVDVCRAIIATRESISPVARHQEIPEADVAQQLGADPIRDSVHDLGAVVRRIDMYPERLLRHWSTTPTIARATAEASASGGSSAASPRAGPYDMCPALCTRTSMRPSFSRIASPA